MSFMMGASHRVDARNRKAWRCLSQVALSSTTYAVGIRGRSNGIESRAGNLQADLDWPWWSSAVSEGRDQCSRRVSTRSLIAPFRTPYQYGQLVLAATTEPEAFDSKIRRRSRLSSPTTASFYMLYIGFDGTGYQTGLATSTDLVNWQRVAALHGAIQTQSTRAITWH